MVDGDGVPGLWGNRERGEEAIGFVVWWLGLLAGLAGAHIVIDEGMHLGPVEVTGDGLDGLVLTKVAGCLSVMGLAQDVDLEGFGVWDVDAALVTEESLFEGEGFEGH